MKKLPRGARLVVFVGALALALACEVDEDTSGADAGGGGVSGGGGGGNDGGGLGGRDGGGLGGRDGGGLGGRDGGGTGGVDGGGTGGTDGGGTGGADGGIPLGECEGGCVALDDCELCMPDDNDECMTVEDCTADCEANDGQDLANCLAAVSDCDEEALDACFEPDVGDDVCARGCIALDDCELCLLNEAEDDCISILECAEGCRGDEELTALAQCMTEVQECDEAAIDLCFEPETGDDPGCEPVCQRGIECEGLPLTDEELAAAMEACITRCGDESTLEGRQCVVDAADCTAAEACPD